MNFAIQLNDAVSPADQPFDVELWIRWSERDFLQFFKRMHLDPKKQEKK